MSSDPERVPVVDGMVGPVRDRWIYAVFSRRAERRVTWVGLEVFVDSDGNCFFAGLSRD